MTAHATRSTPPAATRFEVCRVGLGSHGVRDKTTGRVVPGEAYTGQYSERDARDALRRIRLAYEDGRTPPARTGRNPR